MRSSQKKKRPQKEETIELFHKNSFEKKPKKEAETAPINSSEVKISKEKKKGVRGPTQSNRKK